MVIMVDGEVVEGTVVDAAVKPDFTVTLAGRSVGFKAFTAGQLVMLQALMRRARSDEDQFDAVVSAWNAIESRVILSEDKVFLEMAMLNAELELSDALAVMRQGAPEPEDDDAVPQPLKAKKSAAVANAARKRR
jgi:uncharacterized membrane-anchored protein